MDLDQTTFIIFEDPISREERFDDQVSRKVLMHSNLCLHCLTVLCDGGHFINKVVVKDGTFNRFLAKEDWGKDWNKAQSNVVGFGPG